MDINKLEHEPTDAEVEQFLREFDAGQHQLSDEAKDALSTVGFRRSLQFSFEIERLKRELAAEREAREKAEARLTALWGVYMAAKGWFDKVKPICLESFYQSDSVNEQLPELGEALFSAFNDPTTPPSGESPST